VIAIRPLFSVLFFLENALLSANQLPFNGPPASQLITSSFSVPRRVLYYSGVERPLVFCLFPLFLAFQRSSRKDLRKAALGASVRGSSPSFKRRPLIRNDRRPSSFGSFFFFCEQTFFPIEPKPWTLVLRFIPLSQAGTLNSLRRLDVSVDGPPPLFFLTTVTPPKMSLLLTQGTTLFMLF